MNILKKRLKEFHERFISLRGEPGHIAMGMSIGVFIGVTPTIPFHTAMIIAVGVIFRQNISAGYLGSWIISNPVTVPVFYFFQYELGRRLLCMESCPWTLSDFTLSGLMDLGGHILVPLMTGGIITAPLFAVPAYFLTRRLVTTVRAGEMS